MSVVNRDGGQSIWKLGDLRADIAANLPWLFDAGQFPGWRGNAGIVESTQVTVVQAGWRAKFSC